VILAVGAAVFGHLVGGARSAEPEVDERPLPPAG
jgi:hypothetical protein